jgi:molybdopterin molybdotransferase
MKKVTKPLMPVEQAIETILSTAKPVAETQSVPLLNALGRVLAADQVSTINVPPLDNSAMDGYALRCDDVSEQRLVVSQRIAAGDVGQPLVAGTAARIFTGAPIPVGADSVVMQENVTAHDDGIEILGAVKRGQNIRPLGQDIQQDSCVLKKGEQLRPQEIGLLASIGVEQVDVYRPLKVAVMSTGDELVEPGMPLAEGKIYNSNRYTLSALLMALGCEVVDGGIVKDDLSSTCEQLKTLADSVDVIISSGGVSVGEEDYVKAAVESMGRLSLWKLAIKPGKPLAFGDVLGTPFFGLPGNPSSVFVTFCLCARPYLRAMQGSLDTLAVTTRATAAFDWLRAGTRQEYLRARVLGGQVELFNNQSSGVLASASWANALVVIPVGATVTAGDDVEVLLMSELGC